jgi:D-inositol-3-phosphate glycosyltransferase
MSSNTKRLLITGLYAPGSGLTNVISVLMRELREHYMVSGLGFQSLEIHKSSDIIVSGCPMHVTGSRMPVFMPERGWLDKHMKDVAPKVILVIGPAFLVNNFLGQLQKYRPECRILLYLPLEGKIVSKDIISTIDLVDTCIFYTQYALDNIKELCDIAIKSGSNFRIPTFGVAGHGVDTTEFFPIQGTDKEKFIGKGRAEAKKILFPARPELHNSFMVLNANRAYHRKRLDISIEGFAIFAKNHPNAYLYLHTGTTSDKEKSHLQELIKKSGVESQVLLNALNPDGEKLQVSQLNGLYNMCDVGLTTAMGEGWGLTCFEHAATGAPQIMPNHTSFTENWTGSAILIPPIHKEYVFYEMADMFVVAPKDVAGELKLLYTDPDYYNKMAKAAYRRTQNPIFKWSAIKQKFFEILEESLMSSNLS